jgi:hypothetical protein
MIVHTIGTGMQGIWEIQKRYRDHQPHTEALALLNYFSMGRRQTKWLKIQLTF